MTAWMANASLRRKAGIASMFYLLSVLAAVFGENFAHGKMAIALGLIAVACFVVVTLALYALLRSVSPGVALFATFFNLAAMAFETLRLNPHGVDVATGFHGLYCLLIGYLVFKSGFLPRAPGLLTAFAGLAWMTQLSPALADFLSPYHVAAGFVGEGSLMLYLLVVGAQVHPWKRRAVPAGGAQ